MQARSPIAGGADVFAVCGAVCACALPIPKEGPLGTISVRFNSSPDYIHMAANLALG